MENQELNIYNNEQQESKMIQITEKERQEQDLTRAFKHESDSITAVIGLDCNDIIVAGTLEHFRHVVQVHSHGNASVAAIMFEALRSKEKSHQGDMARVHGLKRESSGRTVEVGIVHQVLDRFQDLLEERTLNKAKFQHFFREIEALEQGLGLGLGLGLARVLRKSARRRSGK